MQIQSTRNSNQKWNNKTCQCECKNYRTREKDYSWNLSICICKNGKYLKSTADTSVIACDEIITVMVIVSTKKTNTIATNVTSTASINCHSKKVRDWYILHTFCFISDHITIENYYYLQLCKTKRYNIKRKIMNFKKFVLKIVRVIISMI